MHLATRPWRGASALACALACVLACVALLGACRTTALRTPDSRTPDPRTPSDPQAAAATDALALGDVVAEHPAAARVFRRHGIDFCCGGRGTLGEAARARGLTAAGLLAEIEAAEREPAADDERRWDAEPAPALIEHIVARYHAGLRTELPRLLDLSHKVDRAHAAHPDRPVGLTLHLEALAADIGTHLRAEEQAVFPRIAAGQALRADPGVAGLVRDHEALALALARTRELAHRFDCPADACPTWRALYAGLADLERDLMVHAHLENNVLFVKLPAA